MFSDKELRTVMASLRYARVNREAVVDSLPYNADHMDDTWYDEQILAEEQIDELHARLEGDLEFATADGTGKLLTALYGKCDETTIGKALGGSQAKMLHDAAELIVSLRAAIARSSEIVKNVAGDAHKAWDADEDHRVGKLLAALVGSMKGYRADTDELHVIFAGGATAKPKLLVIVERGCAEVTAEEGVDYLVVDCDAEPDAEVPPEFAHLA